MTYAETVIAAFATFGLMLAAFKLYHIRWFHKGSMGLVMLFDFAMPFYLYMNRDWKDRLLDNGEILTFLVWMHFGLVLTLFVLYFLQIKIGIQLSKGNNTERQMHQLQGKGIILTRLIVILTGWMLYEPPNG
ncbi:MAG: hypothetical protein OEX00_02625 [Gammaproteobacteria bacterium]|nr:hypothetical protein [Gammaproteobacteria bacterium]MDH5692129.1 hypothetical protein [Gammaproteobacteria bacterium]